MSVAYSVQKETDQLSNTKLDSDKFSNAWSLKEESRVSQAISLFFEAVEIRATAFGITWTELAI